MDYRLIQTITRLAGNLSRRPHLPRLAREIRISVRTLESLFKIHTGQPFASFYRKLRIAEAQSLLAETNTPVKVIAFSLGYKAVEVFCRDFDPSPQYQQDLEEILPYTEAAIRREGQRILSRMKSACAR